MKELIQDHLTSAVETYLSQQDIAIDQFPAIEVDHAKDARHGDFASNIAMVLAKPVRKPPRDIAEGIIDCLSQITILDKCEIAGPGFINFFLSKDAYFQVIPEILDGAEKYGRSNEGGSTKVLLEFVSSNPTGPIHIGHGRGAAYGSVLANLLSASGYDVTREYYVNDYGRQMDILSISVWMRYLDLQDDHDIPFPQNAYHGQYINDIATTIYKDAKDLPQPDTGELHAIINGHAEEDKKLDEIITLAKTTLGENYHNIFFSHALDNILASIKQDLEKFGVEFDNWFSERSLVTSQKVDDCIAALMASGDIYEKDQAKWFRSSSYGDEKDRVVVRENGQATYFASDIAYHVDKYNRGFDEIINIWGADHHGYISRVRGALQASGKDPEKLKILLVQFATLYKGEEKLQMSTRSGDYVTLQQLREEVGNNATRFFYVMRKAEQHLDFDLELAKSESNANPVYYIQYAHARICSVFKQMQDRGMTYNKGMGLESLSMLVEEEELNLVKAITRYPEVIALATRNQEPHQLSFFLRELANDFHGYYNSCQFLVEDEKLCQARLCLISATRQVIKNGLDILGVEAPEEM
ncbi:MAG: arginine--tRNA ligase [Gammaproteobacteria bacterium]|nr:arginine--tRNA ligase [Gammaproteobacteria bacterium]